VPGPGVAFHSGVRSLLGGMATLSLAGCFYIDPINTAPMATIDVSPGPYYVNSTATFTAVAVDPDGDKMHFEWRCTGCLPIFSTNPTYAVRIAVHGEIQVQLAAFDSHGAEDNPRLPIEVTDRPPMVGILIATPANQDGTYTVTKPLLITANASDPDGDPVTYAAAVHAPPASNPNAMQFIASSPTSWTLVPDVPGHWTVDVTASDAFGGSDMITQPIEVAPDEPPCLAVTVPDASSDGHYLVLRDDGPRRFAVASVSDDLDPFPGGGAHFAWSLGPSGTLPAPVIGHDFSDFTIDPSGYLPGDVLDLRVEVADRVARTLPCSADQPRCSIGGNSCFQRETWEVEIR
jgi:hypothetical protein